MNDQIIIGNKAPEFSAKAFFNDSISFQVNLSDYKGKWVLLFFYPLDFTFVCPTELYELGVMREEFEKANCQIIGVSVDSVYSHQAWAKQDDKIASLGFPLVSDITKKISQDYNVLNSDGVSNRGAFVIDQNGNLQAYMVNNLNVGRNPKELLRLVKAFQTGNLCQASWDEGEETLGKA